MQDSVVGPDPVNYISGWQLVITLAGRRSKFMAAGMQALVFSHHDYRL
jgi:hypothetical protein